MSTPWQRILDISADAIISIDERHRIVLFNKGAEEIFGWTADEMMGETLDRLLPERFRSSHGGHIRDFAASPVEARRMGERREIAGLRRNGEEFPAEASISKLGAGDERIYTVVLRDASERKRREQQLQQLIEEAQLAVATRDDVLSFVSHDLGNPLAAIRVASAVLLKRIPADAPERKHVEGIREALDHAQRLIRDLLDIKKLESGKLPLHPETISIDLLIEDAVHAMAPLADERSVRLEHRTGGGLPRVAADPDRVMQVLSNLIGNAIKFSPNDAIVEIESAVHQGEVVTSIRDRGPGIAADELPHIFERYWQAARTGRVGHGLGLAIVHAIVKAHGGSVWAESSPGQGTTVYFSLPVARSLEAAHPHA